jgi:Phosphoinositide phospholipase C, Ca2+-dependent
MKPSAAFFLTTLSMTLGGLAERPRLNQFQAIGSHNSYHLAPPAAVLGVIGKLHQGAVEAWNYSHPPLVRQLSDVGIRQFELDVYADTAGGRFVSPLGWKLANLSGAKLPPFDAAGDLAKPGFKILHVPDIDCWSNTPTLDLALTELLKWSNAHPEHLPVMILVECKDQAHPPLPTKPEPFTRERLLELDAAILKSIPREKLLLPDDVRGTEKSLPEAIKKNGWPEIAKVRGKFLFALDNAGTIRDRYLEENPALEKRVLFVSAPDITHPAAAWFKRNDPRDFEEIQRLVKQGFIVRTRADFTVKERAFDSGAQWVSTDHFSADLPPDQRVAFPGGKLVRPNPLTGGNVKAVDP